jgi:AbiV family abortive infection protein
MLYSQRRFSSAAVLAVFSREEVGRAQMLFEARRLILKGLAVSGTELENKCAKHVDKLTQSLISTTFVLPPGRYRWNVKDLRGDIDDIADRWRKKRPDALHQQRKAALYVTPNNSGRGWNRPCRLGEQDCELILIDVMNNYRFYTGEHLAQDSELKAAFEAWQARPQLPQPELPVKR